MRFVAVIQHYKEVSKMTNYKSSKKTGSKLLIPAATLLLCVFALIGAGYAASVSSVAVNKNVVETDILVLTLTDTDGNIAEGGFSLDSALLDMGADTVMDGDDTSIVYYVNSFTAKAFGESTLKIDASESTATKIKLTYDKSALDAAIPYGMTAVLKVTNNLNEEVVIPADGSDGVELTITKDGDNEFVVKLYLSLDDKYTLKDTDLDGGKPTEIQYPVKLIATPVV